MLAGVLVTFGSAGIVGQAMSGLLLMYARGYKAGDFIRVGTTEGTVIELGLLSTRIRNVANEFILVPNSTMVSGSITDFSAAGREGQSLFVTASVTIGYDAPWQRIHESLLAAGAKLPGAQRSPEAFVLQRALNDFYVAYEVFVPINSDRATSLPQLRSQLNSLIQDTFWAAGQEITSPHFFAVRDGNEITIPPESKPPASGRALPRGGRPDVGHADRRVEGWTGRRGAPHRAPRFLVPRCAAPSGRGTAPNPMCPRAPQGGSVAGQNGQESTKARKLEMALARNWWVMSLGNVPDVSSGPRSQCINRWVRDSSRGSTSVRLRSSCP